MLKKNVNLILAVSSVAIVGCSSAILKTSSIPGTVPSAEYEYKDRVGSIYFLPKALVPLNIAFKDKSGGGSDSKQNTTSTAQVTNTIIVNGETSKATSDNNTKPDNNANAGADKKIPNLDFTISLGDLKYFPDTTQAYFLEHNENWLFDDNITIEVGDNQLLQTVDSSAKDETGPAMVKIADLAGTVARMVAPVPVPPGLNAPLSIQGPLPPTKTRQATELLLHPPVKYVCTIPDSKKNVGAVWFDLGQKNAFEGVSVDNINQRLFEAHLPIEITAKPLVKDENLNNLQSYPSLNRWQRNDEFIASDLTDFDGCKAWRECISKGVLVRSPIPYLITVTVSKSIDDHKPVSRFYREYDGSKDTAVDQNMIVTDDGLKCLSKFDVNENTQMAMVMAPNDGPITSVDDSRASFITKKTTLTIANGMLKKINVDQPSQFLGFISSPVDALKAIAAIPGSILSMKIQNTNDQASLYKAQTDLLTQLQALQQMQNSKTPTSP